MKTSSACQIDSNPQPGGSGRQRSLTSLIVRAYALELILPRAPKPLLLIERIGVFPASGEIRCRAQNGATLLAGIKQRYAAEALDIDERNGLSLVFADWRFWLRLCAAGNEACLNVQSRGDIALLHSKTRELLMQIAPLAERPPSQ